MIATITLNPSLDKAVNVDGLVLEETNRGSNYMRYPGGKGINVSRVIHELGGETVAYGFIGGFDGDILMSLLRQQGVPHDFTEIKGEIRSNFIITDLNINAQTRIDAPGPHISPEEMESLKNKLRNLKPRPQYAVMAGSVPPGIPSDIYREFIIYARKQGIKTVLDADGKWLKEGIKAVPDIVKPNVHEAEQLLGIQLKDEEAIMAAVAKLIEMGIEIAAISRGKDGMIIANREVMLNLIPPRVEVDSTVGAGDSTIAGLVLKLSSGANLIEAARLAVAAGTAATLTPGTELCHRSDVDRILPLVAVRKL